MADSPGEPLIASASDLEELVAHLRASGEFAFDTEFVSEETFEPVLCLIQVATRERIAAIDALAVRDLSSFWAVVNDPDVEVIMHAASEDLRICRFQTGTVPRRVYDVQIAAGLAGFGYPLSLGNLMAQALRITVAGGETRTDWRRRPLSPPQLRYALDDVRYLLDLADLLKVQLAELDRASWAESEFAQFVAAIQNRVEEERWRKLSGLHQLSRRGLEGRPPPGRVAVRGGAADEPAAAPALARRPSRGDRQATAGDAPRPGGAARLQPPSPARQERRGPGGDHLGASRSLRRVAGAARPARRGPGSDHGREPAAAAMAQCCVQHRVAPGLVGASNDLKSLIRWHGQGRPEDHRPELTRGWRRDVCGATLLDVLSGRIALRVVDPLSDVPVALEPIGPAGGRPSTNE